MPRFSGLTSISSSIEIHCKQKQRRQIRISSNLVATHPNNHIVVTSTVNSCSLEVIPMENTAVIPELSCGFTASKCCNSANNHQIRQPRGQNHEENYSNHLPKLLRHRTHHQRDATLIFKELDFLTVYKLFGLWGPRDHTAFHLQTHQRSRQLRTAHLLCFFTFIFNACFLCC